MRINQKGITLTSLIITIVVLVILSGVTLYTGGNIIKNVRLQNINTNMMLIQAKAKTIAEQAKFNKNTSNYKGVAINSITNNKNIDKLREQRVIEDEANYYLLSEVDLINMGLEKIDIEAGYIVNYNTEEVIYVKGFENNGTTYYKLSEMKGLKLE